MRHFDTVDGHRLEVGPGWDAYPPKERATICNGVGGADQPQWQRVLLAAMPHLLPASRPHDVDYHHGGSSADRLSSDRRFRRNCLRVAKRAIGPWWKRWLVPFYRARWLFALAEINSAYMALRIMGRPYFNYTEIEVKSIEAQ